MSNHEFGFNSIRVVQALRPGDSPTAKKLYDNTILPIKYAKYLDTIPTVDYTSIDTRQAFVEYLHALVEEASSCRLRPILHIEAHGGVDGLEMPDGKIAQWDVIASYLRVVNCGSGFNLLLVLGACNGAHFVRSVLPTEPASAWAVIGPQAKVYDRDLLRAYTAFYEELLTTLDATRAYDRAVQEMPRGIHDFGLYTAAMMFETFIKVYLRHCTDQEAVRSRANRLMCKIVHERPELRARKDDVVREIMAWARDPRKRFEELHTVFFMHDLLPDNPRSVEWEHLMPELR